LGFLLVFEIVFICDEEGGEFFVLRGLGLIKPLGDVVEGVAIADAVDEDNTN
jgi:hypothetical protein